jgi:hypothetical protein
MERWRGWLQDASGSVADLGVLAPIAAALILGNGLDAGTVLVGAGALYLAAGLYFRVPVPVQPIKAAAAIAIARGLPPETIGAAGAVLGVLLVVLAATGAARLLARVFAPPLVRGLQLGVGLILIRTAIDLASPSGHLIPLVVAGTVTVSLVIAARMRRAIPLALLLVVGAGAWTALATGHTPALDIAIWEPHLNPGVIDVSMLTSALVLLVIPQIPLTFGNAVVAVVDLEHRYFPLDARRVTPATVSYSCGLANVAVGALGGMPLCHGSGGLTAHYRAGARTYRMNALIGGLLLVMGLFFGPVAFGIIGLIPAAMLAGFLAFTGLFHSSLVVELRRSDLAIAVLMGIMGLLTTNLAIALAVGLVAYWPLTVAVGRGAEPVRS